VEVQVSCVCHYRNPLFSLFCSIAVSLTSCSSPFFFLRSTVCFTSSVACAGAAACRGQLVRRSGGLPGAACAQERRLAEGSFCFCLVELVLLLQMSDFYIPHKKIGKGFPKEFATQSFQQFKTCNRSLCLIFKANYYAVFHFLSAR